VAGNTVENRSLLFLEVQLIQNNGRLLLPQDNTLGIVSLIIVISIIITVTAIIINIIIIILGVDRRLLLLKQVCYLLLMLTLTLALKECCQTCLCIQTLQTINRK
jgi:hypothetical protein